MRDFFCRKANRATRKLPFFKRINVLAAAWFQFLKEKAVFGDNRNSFHSILTEKTQAVFTGKGSMCSIWKWPYSDITLRMRLKKAWKYMINIRFIPVICFDCSRHIKTKISSAPKNVFILSMDRAECRFCKH